MFQICEFDEIRDVMSTVEGLSIDLDKAIESGVVLDSGTTQEFNNIEEPTSIGRRVSSVFDALDIQRSLMKKVSDKVGKK